ncbi:MAG: arginyltransferase [Candidatus Obscuribacterales bacterium]|nr:arginyltransferase [Candidatus Obscuribacterales bacterium]
MEIVEKHITRPDKCGYLPDRKWRLEYNFVAHLSSSEYLELLNEGWRKYGHALFRPVCQACTECRPIRVLVDDFKLNRSQQRTVRKNQDIEVRIESGEPNPQIFELYSRHHGSRAKEVGWPQPNFRDSIMHLSSLVDNPFPIQQWCHYLDGRLIGVCYADPLPLGLSAVYSFYDPGFKPRSLGTWMILSLIDYAKSLSMPYVYLGYFVEGCRSMTYKKNFLPHEVQSSDATWHACFENS